MPIRNSVTYQGYRSRCVARGACFEQDSLEADGASEWDAYNSGRGSRHATIRSYRGRSESLYAQLIICVGFNALGECECALLRRVAMCACLGLVEAKMPGLDDLGGVPIGVQRDNVGAIDVLEEIVLVAEKGLHHGRGSWSWALVPTVIVVFVRHAVVECMQIGTNTIFCIRA